MQPFGRPFGGFERQRLQRMGEEKFSFFLGLFRVLADAFTGAHHEQHNMVALALLRLQDVVAQAQPVGFRPWP